MMNSKLCYLIPLLTCQFQTNPCQHPIIILRDIEEEDLKSLLKFMYNGEVRIPEDRMKDFLRTAETLQIRGLTDGGVTREPCAKNPNVSDFERLYEQHILLSKNLQFCRVQEFKRI